MSYFFLPIPPLSVGAGLGNWVTHLWYRTHLRSFWPGFKWFLAYPVLFSFSVLPIPPGWRAGGDLGKLTTHTGAQNRLDFCANLSLVRRHYLVPPPLQVVWRWLPLTLYSRPLRLGLSLFLSFFIPCRLRNFAVQRYESGFRGTACSAHVLVESGFP